MGEKITWAIQHGLDKTNTDKLQTLWVETAGYCNLHCPYCFAATDKINKSRLLTYREIEEILCQASAMGVGYLGIPGAGEPLLPRNIEMTLRIIRKCAELGIFVALFTTGEFLTKALIDLLFALPVELLIKCNALDPDLQNRFVSDPTKGKVVRGYGAKRNRAVEQLLEKGFEDKHASARFHRVSRLGLVTSIMTTDDHALSNLAEIPEIFRFCRRNNIIFDCDSILKRGRGVSCQLHASDNEYKNMVQQLKRIDKEEFGHIWPMTQSYVGGAACDRYFHHLYITQYGEIHPCIGATGVNLGNVRSTTLEQAWNSSEERIIRTRCYGGICGNECANFSAKTCNSCLGRRTVNLTNQSLLATGKVQTIGCWNFRKKT